MNDSRPGRPTRQEANAASVGRDWRDLIRDDIARQGLSRPRTNWYREKIRGLLYVSRNMGLVASLPC